MAQKIPYTMSMLLKLFLIVQSFLYFLFIFRDLNNEPSSKIKFLTLFLCFVCAVVLLFSKKEKNRRWIALGLALTAVADWFFMIEDSHYALAVGLFCTVETIYALLIGGRYSILLRIVIVAAVYLAFYLFKTDIDITGLLSVYSFVFLCVNFIFSFRTKKHSFYYRSWFVYAVRFECRFI